MSDSPNFHANEKFLSQLPAMELLAKMGWQPLTPAQANAKRRGQSAVILEDITREFLGAQTITRGGKTLKLGEETIGKLIAKLKKLPHDTFGKQAQSVWEMLTLPQSVELLVEGKKRGVNFKFIDFDKWENNFFHFVPEFVVQRQNTTPMGDKTRRPDIVLFVNGIPLAVVENKSAEVDVEDGVSQTIRNQQLDEIPRLYVYAQVLLSLNKNDNRYGTTGTPDILWSRWREKELTEADIQKIIAAPILLEAQSAIAEGLNVRPSELSQENPRSVIQQDYALAGLCRPNRLLRMTRNFVLFSGPTKIIARFQQVSSIGKTLKLVCDGSAKKPRDGGVIWHTQGSGKSLTMVLLARALIGNKEFKNPRVVLVTDRVDLDKQIKGTFQNANMEPKRANTSKELTQLINAKQAGIITAIINKFDNAVGRGAKDESRDIFVLVDEAHRAQYGRYHAQMRRVFPNACFLGFTGTPLSQEERNTINRFGGLIDTYTMRDAIADGAVVPLVYEGRMIKPEMSKKAIDTWVKSKTADMTKRQKQDFNKQYAYYANELSERKQIVERRAEDICKHYREKFRRRGLKGQLVAPTKKAAIKYKAELEKGGVTCEVLISSPDTRKGHKTVDEGKSTIEVVDFWKQMMTRWGDEAKYNEGVISQFKNDDNPEIIIVVSKLLTGFDAPRNGVLYLAKNFESGAALLQAVARVNRVLASNEEEGSVEKESGFVMDYEGVMENLGNAVAEYDVLAGYDKKEIGEIFRPTKETLADVPQKHGALLDIFKTLGKNADQEAYQRFLREQSVREDFYEAFTDFAKALKNALATARFYEETPEDTIARYKADFDRFAKLRAVVRVLYGEKVDFKKYERELQTVLDRNVFASNIKQIVKEVDILSLPHKKREEIARQHKKAAAAIADRIASETKRVLTEKMPTNPAFYGELSKQLQKTIDAFIKRRLSEAEFFKRAKDIHDSAKQGVSEATPPALKGRPDAMAFYRHLAKDSPLSQKEGGKKAAVALSLFFADCLRSHDTVEMFEQTEIVNQIRKELGDFIYETLIDKDGVELTEKEMDDIQEKLLRIAQNPTEQ